MYVRELRKHWLHQTSYYYKCGGLCGTISRFYRSILPCKQVSNWACRSQTPFDTWSFWLFYSFECVHAKTLTFWICRSQIWFDTWSQIWFDTWSFIIILITMLLSVKNDLEKPSVIRGPSLRSCLEYTSRLFQNRSWPPKACDWYINYYPIKAWTHLRCNLHLL